MMNEKFFALKHRHAKDYLQRLERDDPQRFWRGMLRLCLAMAREDAVREKHLRKY